MVVTKLPNDGKEATVAVEGTNVSVTVPSSLLSSIGEPVAAVISVFEGADFLERLQGVDDSGYEAKLQSAMKMELHTPSGLHKVAGLAEPLLLQMPPVNKSSAVECAYWDVAKGRWAYDGVQAKWVGNSLVCAATHLTLFAAILRGILTALACSQLTLFNGDAMRALSKSKWLTTPVGVAYILLLLLFASLMFAAYRIDKRRSKFWSDEFFLIPRSTVQNEEGEVQMGQTESFQPRKSSTTHRVLMCLVACKESTTYAMKEACVEIASSFFEFISSAREIFGQCHEALRHHEDCKTVVQQTMAHLTLSSLRQQLGADIGFSDEAVEFVMGDDELLKLFEDAAVKAECEGISASRSLQAWYDLHEKVAESIDHTWKHVGTFRRFPVAIWRLFLLINPFVAVYTVNPFWPSTLRLLILMCELSGSLLLGVVLFQNTAGAMGSDSPDDCEANGFWEQVGQMIVIGTFSALFAALPAALLSTLHHRKLVKCDFERCDNWNRQLRVWRTKDKVLWFFGLLYIFFALFVVALFCANIHPNDQPDWGVSGLTSLAEDALIAPLAMALIVPLLAISSVALAGCLTGTRRAEVLRSRREELESEGTWKLLPSVSRQTRSRMTSV